jgi:hypothetical protein
MPDPPRRPELQRFALGAPDAGVSPAPAWGVLALQAGLIAGAVCVAIAPWATPTARAIAAVLMVALAGFVHQVSSRRRRPPKAWLVVDDRGVHRRDERDGAAPPVTLAEWREPIGATILASADRMRFLIALTTERATRFVSVRGATGEDVARAPTLIERATTTPDSDLRTDDESSLTTADAERLLRTLAERAPLSLDRLYLSDAGGEPLVLDRTELRVGLRRIDLDAPLEWRAFLFQEVGAQAASVCQSTWVRQGDIEVFLVAPMAADGTWLPDTEDAARFGLLAAEGGTVQRSLARDFRLMQASVSEPPPRELRRAIDRLFMLPLRRALDRAPRVSKFPSSSSSQPRARA